MVMNTLALLVLCLAPACQDTWRDTHRVYLRNGNFLDGRLEQIGQKDILFRWSPGVLMRIKLADIKGDIEEIKIRTLNSQPAKVAVKDPPPVEKDPAVIEKPPTRDPGKPPSEIDKFFTKLLAQPDMTFEVLAKEVKGLGVEGGRAIIAELPQMDAQRTDIAFVSLDQMRELPLDREIRGLLESRRPDIRAGAVNLLANRNSTESLRAVLGLLKDPAPSVRTAALMALPNFNDSSVLGPVAELAIDPDAQVRGRAIHAAKELSGRTSQDNDLASRWLLMLGRGSAAAIGEVAMALSQLADRAGEDFPMDDVRDRLMRLLSDRDPASRGAAAYALTSIKPPEQSGDAIFAAFETERDPKVVVHMSDALARLRVTKAVEPLIEKLREDNKDVRPAAQRALEKITGNTEFGADYEKWKEWHDKSKGQNP
jgi:HEAT repeat protein